MTEAELAEIIRHAIDKSCVYVGGADPLNAVTVDGTVDLLQVARDVLEALKPEGNEAHAAHQSALQARSRVGPHPTVPEPPERPWRVPGGAA